MEISHLKKIIRKWPAYGKFLETSGITLGKVKDLSELPVVDKSFIYSAIHMVPLFKVRSIIPSSGTSGKDFSFGLFGDADLKRTSRSMDTLMKNRFNTANKKTLLLNMLPGAVSIQSSTASVASIGVRLDAAISVIKSFGSSFDQLILLGEPLFIKCLLEQGTADSIMWKHIPISIIVCGEWVPESFTKYLKTIVGPRQIYSFMGIAELGLNYFLETEETLLLRHLMFEDKRLLKMLVGDPGFCPMTFVYDENQVFVETLRQEGSPFESIVMTTLNPNRTLPLIRYKSGDAGKVISREKINLALKSIGYAPIFSTPGPPILAHMGRGKGLSNIHPEEIKERIYNNLRVASTTTGNFKLRNKRNALQLDLQLKEGIPAHSGNKSEYEKAFAHLPLQVTLHPFESFPCSLDFERKVHYASESNDLTWDQEKVSVSSAGEQEQSVNER